MKKIFLLLLVFVSFAFAQFLKNYTYYQDDSQCYKRDAVPYFVDSRCAYGGDENLGWFFLPYYPYYRITHRYGDTSHTCPESQSYSTTEYYHYTKVSLSECQQFTCPSGQVMINGKCQISCKSNQFLKNGKCVSYCNSPLQYVTNNGKKYCKSSDLDEKDCQSKGYYWFSNIAFKSNPNFIPLPTGCYSKDITKQYLTSEGHKLALALSISQIPGMGIALDDASSFAVSKFRKIFGGAKSLWDFIKNKFSSNNSNDMQDLTNQNIKVTDLKMTDQGVDPIINLTPLQDLPDDVAWSVPDNIDSSSSAYDGNMPVDKFDFSSLEQTSNQLDNMPSEIPSYTDNIIGTKNILDNSKDISSYLDSATEINTPVKSKIDISDSLVKPTETRQFDLDTIKISEDNSGSHPVIKYKQIIKYPDGSNTVLHITQTDLGSSGKTYDITTTTPLSNGDTFTKTYHIQKSSSGSILNSFQDPSTITKINPDGSTEVVLNSSPDLSISKTKPEISLIPITTKLQEIENKQDMTNQKLDDIDNNFRDMIDYKPPVNDDFDQSLNNFKNALTNYDLNMSNFLGYLSNFKNSLQNLKTNFDNSKNILEKKPTLTLSSGSCGFNIHAFRRDYHVDPCMFVTPYRPILVVFFTLLGTFSVIIFAVKFLISRGAE